MAHIKLIATVRGSITISAGPLVGNNVDTASWISGNVLRGAFAAYWQADKNHDDFLDLFCRGKIVFHGLFPLPSNPNERIDFLDNNFFPFRIPQAVFSCKYQPWTAGYLPHPIVNKAKNGSVSKCECGAPLIQAKSPEFYYHDGKKPWPIKQKRETHLYHGTDRNTRRAEDAALYSYTSIPDGEGFIGWLSGDKKDLQAIYDQMNQSPHRFRDQNGNLVLPLNVGRGKKRRGHLEAIIHKPQDDEPALPGEEVFASVSNSIIVVLQTPAILHDPCFRAATTLMPEHILPGVSGISKYDSGEFSSMTLLEGWSGIHGLPRRPEQALAAGSTFFFKKAPTCTEDLTKKLVAIQNQGVGERQLEGYGRVIINPTILG